MVPMNKKIVILLITVLAAITITGCRLKGEDIGNLYGRWHLHSISDQDGIIYEPDTVYLSFMATVYEYQPNWKYDWGTFERKGDSLTLNPLAYMSAFGFRDLMHNDAYDGLKPISFEIRTLTDNDLILQRSDTIWIFCKFLD